MRARCRTTPTRRLLRSARKHFTELEDFPEARAFWWPRYLRIARWFADWERGRRTRIAELDAETYGRIRIPLGEREFQLSTRADRIERLADGGYAILDYKTGSVPTEKQVRIGVSPQLTLEAAILRQGGFGKIPPGVSVSELVYVSLRGAQHAGEERIINLDGGPPDAHADRALAKLTMLASRFEDPEQPYRPLVLSMWKNRYGAYDHLARVKEWSAMGEEDFEIPGSGR